MDFQIEGDGVIGNFYKLIWEKQQRDKGLRGFLLPHTVVYKHQQPRAWYFSTIEGYIKRKLKEKLTAAHIEHVFLKNISKSGIVAFFTYIGANGREIEYFQAADFRNFIHNRHKNYDGVLQKFIDPKGVNNSTLQMIWTTHLCVFELRENSNSLFDTRLDIYERVVTFEGEDHQSQVKPFRSNELRYLMQEIGEALVEHFCIVSAGKIKPTRMVIIFKVNQQSRLYLLMAMSIRCTSLVPIDISCNSKFPEVVNCKRSASNSKSPMCVQKKILCKNCERSCEADRMYEIKYKDIVKKQKKTIPKILLNIYPRLALQDYLEYRKDEVFLRKIALVCDECYLMFMQGPKPIQISTRVEASKTPQPTSTTPLTTDRTLRTPTKLTETQRVVPRLSYPSLPVLKFNRQKHNFLPIGCKLSF